MKSTLLLLIISLTFSYATQGNIAMHGTEKAANTQIFYGKILEIKNAMGYKYLKVNEDGKELWVAIANAPVAVGDKIGYDKKTVMHDFESKTLSQKFKEIIFASDVYLAQKNTRVKSMKALLGLEKKEAFADPHAGMGMNEPKEEEKEEKPAKPFEVKDFYTVEEVYMWKKSLKGKKVKVKGTVYKVSHQIMKKDWVHIGDGTGNEQEITDDLVFTCKASDLKAGTKVVASGEVVVDKDFGYGYFYKAIVKDSSFEAIK